MSEQTIERLQERIEELEARVTRLERLLEAHAHGSGGWTIVEEGEWPNRHGVALREILAQPVTNDETHSSRVR